MARARVFRSAQRARLHVDQLVYYKRNGKRLVYSLIKHDTCGLSRDNTGDFNGDFIVALYPQFEFARNLVQLTEIFRSLNVWRIQSCGAMLRQNRHRNHFSCRTTNLLV